MLVYRTSFLQNDLKIVIFPIMAILNKLVDSIVGVPSMRKTRDFRMEAIRSMYDPTIYNEIATRQRTRATEGISDLVEQQALRRSVDQMNRPIDYSMVGGNAARGMAMSNMQQLQGNQGYSDVTAQLAQMDETIRNQYGDAYAQTVGMQSQMMGQRRAGLANEQAVFNEERSARRRALGTQLAKGAFSLAAGVATAGITSALGIGGAAAGGAAGAANTGAGAAAGAATGGLLGGGIAGTMLGMVGGVLGTRLAANRAEKQIMAEAKTRREANVVDPGRFRTETPTLSSPPRNYGNYFSESNNQQNAFNRTTSGRVMPSAADRQQAINDFRFPLLGSDVDLDFPQVDYDSMRMFPITQDPNWMLSPQPGLRGGTGKPKPQNRLMQPPGLLPLNFY